MQVHLNVIDAGIESSSDNNISCEAWTASFYHFLTEWRKNSKRWRTWRFPFECLGISSSLEPLRKSISGETTKKCKRQQIEFFSRAAQSCVKLVSQSLAPFLRVEWATVTLGVGGQLKSAGWMSVWHDDVTTLSVNPFQLNVSINLTVKLG